MRRKIIYALIMLTMIAFIFVCCDEEEEIKKETIRIGGIFPLISGGSSVWGQSVAYGSQLAVEEIRAKGLVLGKEIELVVGDDGGDAETAVTVCQDLINQGCVAIVGPTSSSRAIAVAEEVCIPQLIPLITPSGTSPSITGLIDNNMVWRTAPSDAFQGEAAANYAYNVLNKTTAAILYLEGAYGEGLAEMFENSFVNLGGTVLTKVEFEDLESYKSYDFTNKVNLLFSNNPEIVYLITFVSSGIKVTTTIDAQIDLSYEPVLLGCDANYDIDFLPPNSPAEVVEGMIGFSPTSAVDNPNNIAFNSNYLSRFGIDPSTSYAMNSYDAVYLLAYALLEAGSTNSTEIVNQLLKVSSSGSVINVNEFDLASSKIAAGEDIDYNGASGDLDLDANGDIVSGTYVVWKIENSVFVEDSIITYPN